MDGWISSQPRKWGYTFPAAESTEGRLTVIFVRMTQQLHHRNCNSTQHLCLFSFFKWTLLNPDITAVPAGFHVVSYRRAQDRSVTPVSRGQPSVLLSLRSWSRHLFQGRPGHRLQLGSGRRPSDRSVWHLAPSRKFFCLHWWHWETYLFIVMRMREIKRLLKRRKAFPLLW